VSFINLNQFIPRLFSITYTVLKLILIQLAFTFIINAQSLPTCKYKQAEGNYLGQEITLEDVGQQLYIPTVFHIVYSTPEQNISDEQIRVQLKVLNEDFNKKNSDTINTLPVFRHLAGNSKIFFFLAHEDDYGNQTNGITRTSSAHGPFANNDIHYSDLGGKNPWPTNKYLNIWVCNLADGVFGFASSPGTSVFTDGVVIDFEYIASINTATPQFSKGRTATHEVGHWAGLKHLWGSSGGCMDDDGIADTPQQIGPSSGCSLARNTCGELNMVQNFMDTSVDECMNLFTIGQVKEMRKNLFAFRQENIRSEIVTGLTNSNTFQLELIHTANGNYRIEFEFPIDSILLYNFLGQQLYYSNEQKTENELTLDFNGLNGFFIVAIISGNSRYSKKVFLH
jgi:hypothetical protein